MSRCCAASPPISPPRTRSTRFDFARFADGLRIERDYPGIQGVGYAAALEPGGEGALETRIRAEGHDDFSVWPERRRHRLGGGRAHRDRLSGAGGRCEPRGAGLRHGLGGHRREAMLRARDEGRATASGRVTLVQEDATNPQPGFLVYLPVYEGGSIR